MPVVGDVLPEPYISWLGGPVGIRRERTCISCDYVWETSEIPMFTNWKDGPANCCPVHDGTLGKIIAYASPHKMDRGIGRGDGTQFARQHGAYYRRYLCKMKGCMDVKYNKRKRPRFELKTRRRWSTFEVLAAGVIVPNVTACPKCRCLGRVTLLPDGRRRWQTTAL